MDAKLIEELRQKYSKNPPEGMTSNLIKNMTDSDLLDMHYFLTEDDDLDDDEFEEGFYIDFFYSIVCFLCPLLCGLFLSRLRRMSNFPII